MRRLTTRILSSAALPALFLFSCGDDGNPSDSGVTSAYATACKKIITETYTLSFPSSDSAVAVSPQRTDTAYGCIGSTLGTTPISVAADTTYYHYRLASANYLAWMEAGFDALLKGYISAGAGINLDSVDIFVLYARQSGGTGLSGVWQLDSITYDAHRSLNIIEKAVLDSLVKSQSATYPTNDSEFIEINGSVLTFFHTWSAAEACMKEWAADSAGYAITTRTLNDCELQLTGTLSGEVVTISGDSEGNTVFRSTSADFPDHTYYPVNPRACPNTKRPSWWQTFLDHNKRP